MKTATAFLVAVTVFTSLFLESSTAPNPFLGELNSNLDKVVTSVGGVVSDTVKVVDGVVSDTGKVVGGVVREVDTLATGVFEVVTQAVGKIVKDVTGLLGGLLRTVETIENELGEKLKKALTKAKRAFEEVTDVAENIIKAAAEDANDTVKELDSLLKKAVKKLDARLAAVTDIVKISEKAGDDASVVVNEVKAVVAIVAEGVKNILSDVDKVKSKTSKAVDDRNKFT